MEWPFALVATATVQGAGTTVAPPVVDNDVGKQIDEEAQQQQVVAVVSMTPDDDKGQNPKEALGNQNDDATRVYEFPIICTTNTGTTAFQPTVTVVPMGPARARKHYCRSSRRRDHHPTQQQEHRQQQEGGGSQSGIKRPRQVLEHIASNSNAKQDPDQKISRRDDQHNRAHKTTAIDQTTVQVVEADDSNDCHSRKAASSVIELGHTNSKENHVMESKPQQHRLLNENSCAIAVKADLDPQDPESSNNNNNYLSEMLSLPVVVAVSSLTWWT